MTDEATRVALLTGVKIGDVIGERYRVEQVLGAGAMGVVVAARHMKLDDPVAIKFLAADLIRNENALGRFDREARAAAKIKHEHVIRVYDVGQLDNGIPYLVMERLTGSDLATLLHNDGPLPLEQALDVMRQACAGIAEAHRLGVVHRDIKPSNLFCVPHPSGRRTVKVLDFGISKLVEAPNGSITGTSSLLGSPSYMSPEQMRAPNRVDPRTDVWSLGVVLYELSTGTLPFGGSTYPELCLSVTTDAPEPPRSRCPELPVELEGILLKCLHKDRDLRFATVDELARALEAFAERHRDTLPTASAPPRTAAPAKSGVVSPPTLTAPSRWVADPAPPQASTAAKSTWSRTLGSLVTLPRSQQLLLGAVVTVVAAAAIAIGIAVWWQGSTRPVPAAASVARSSEPPRRESVVAAPPPPVSAQPLASATGAVRATPAGSSSVSIRALGTKPPAPAKPAPTPAASRAPLRPNKKQTQPIPLERSNSSIWTDRE